MDTTLSNEHTASTRPTSDKVTMKECLRSSAWTALGFSVVLAGTAQASGFRVPEVSLSGLGEANAQVADAQEIGALPYNPAAMSYHKGMNATGGILGVDPNLSVTTASGAHNSEGRSPIYIPNVYVMGPINEQFTWGVGLNAPFGLETKWSSGTFSTFAGPLAAAAPTLSKIEMVNINPNLAYRFGATSLALGIDYYNIMDVALNTSALDMSGDGADLGYNLAALHTMGPMSLGLSYRSGIDVDIDGSAVQLGAPSAAQTTLKLPSMLQMGVRYQVSASLALEFDIERTGWSNFDSIVITRSSATTITSTNNWKDANAYRLGGRYDLSPTTQLRFGYAFDETGQPDSHFNARIPDADRHLFSIGIKQEVAGWGLEAGYMYVQFDERKVDSSTPYTPGGDPNGTSAYNGTYEASVHLLAIGIGKKF